MSNFKKQLDKKPDMSPPRYAIPQVDPERPKPTPAAVVEAPVQATPVISVEPTASVVTPAQDADQAIRLATVDGSEAPMSRGTQMRPSRHEQLRDLAYLENRKFWLIIDDALEEYVVRHYGKQYKRKQ